MAAALVDQLLFPPDAYVLSVKYNRIVFAATSRENSKCYCFILKKIYEASTSSSWLLQFPFLLTIPCMNNIGGYNCPKSFEFNLILINFLGTLTLCCAAYSYFIYLNIHCNYLNCFLGLTEVYKTHTFLKEKGSLR